MIDSIPKITVVTPSFNQGQFLETTIRSVLDQNYPNLEYIVMDGGSTDTSVEIIKKYADRIAHWESGKDNGMYHAIHKGFERGTGEIMAWINSDDILHRNSLFSVAEIFSNFKEVKWLVGAANYIDEKDRLVYANQAAGWSKYRFLSFDFRYLHQESTFWRRELWEKAGSYMDTNQQLAGDFELWLRFFRHEQCYSTYALLGSHRSRSGNQKSVDQIGLYDEEAIKLIEKELLNLDAEDKRRLFWINLFKNTLMAFPIVKGTFQAKRYYEKLLCLPPHIELDRNTQLFKFSTY